MSKVDKLYEELFPTAADGSLKWFKEEKESKEIIKKHFQDIHDEAVAATVMACNKKQFYPPKFTNE